MLHRLVNGGHSVVAIEHDLDVIAEADWVIAEADWVIDLGPDGGNAGGSLVAAAPPETVVKLRTHTGNALRGVLERTYCSYFRSCLRSYLLVYSTICFLKRAENRSIWQKRGPLNFNQHRIIRQQAAHLHPRAHHRLGAKLAAHRVTSWVVPQVSEILPNLKTSFICPRLALALCLTRFSTTVLWNN